MDRTIRLDLLNFPHFFGPRDKPKKAPTLRKIIDEFFRNDLDAIALSSCHTGTGGFDHRWSDYMGQRAELDDAYHHELKAGGILNVVPKGPGSHPEGITLLHSQKVRAYHKGLPTDLNIIGASELIAPSREIDITARDAKDKGAIVIVCHPGSRCGAPLEKALEMVHLCLADGVDISASNSKKNNEEVIRGLINGGIFPISVTGGHSYKVAGTAYITIDSPFDQKFSMGSLGERIRAGDYNSHPGNISLVKRFLTRDRHIIASMPGHLLASGMRASEYLKAIGVKK